MNKLGILVIVILVSMLSCKRSPSTIKTSPSTIKHFTLNLFYDASANAVLQNVDYNKDSVSVFELHCDRHYGFSSSRITLSRQVSTLFPMDFAVKFDGVGASYPVNVLLKTDDSISDQVGVWQPNSVLFLSDAINPSLGLNNKGPAYIVFRFRNLAISSSDYYYGWIKVDVADKYKVNFIEIAYETIPNKTIKASQTKS